MAVVIKYDISCRAIQEGKLLRELYNSNKVLIHIGYVVPEDILSNSKMAFAIWR